MAQLLAEAVADLFVVEDITFGLGPQRRGVRLRGRLRLPSEQAFEIISSRFQKLGYTPYLRRDGERHAILAVPGVSTPRKLDPRVNFVLFLLTVASVTFSGLYWIARPESWTLTEMAPGLGFAAGLLAILVAHEAGHYIVARRLGVPISLPYFIPFPFFFFGTMGATEIIAGPLRNRRVLLAMGAAGPLAGLAVAIPVLIIGLLLSEVQRIPIGVPLITEGNSLLYLGIKYLLFGRLLPSGGYDVFIHPIAFAGWGGLLVTSFNLIPAGQLDGGHIVYALFGKQVNRLIWPIFIALAFLSIRWPGWLLWVFLLFLLGRGHPEPLDDITELRPSERALGILMLVIFALVFTPVPLRIG